MRKSRKFWQSCRALLIKSIRHSLSAVNKHSLAIQSEDDDKTALNIIWHVAQVVSNITTQREPDPKLKYIILKHKSAAWRRKHLGPDALNCCRFRT